jgi:hypothetical protein
MQDTVIVMLEKEIGDHGGAGFEWLIFGEIRVAAILDLWNLELFIPFDTRPLT